jgi:hypothetical protein
MHAVHRSQRDPSVSSASTVLQRGEWMISNRMIWTALMCAMMGAAAGCMSDASGASAADEFEVGRVPQALAEDQPEVWRPFNAQSPWNIAIEAGAAADRESASMIDDWKSSSTFGPKLGVNKDGFSIPLFWADANTPKTMVQCQVGGSGFDSEDGTDATASIPMPDAAQPDPLSDRHLLIVDRDKRREWGMWNATHDERGWQCGVGAEMDLDGDGVRPPAETNETWYTSHGPRACGFPLIAGLIRPEEIEAGRIDHALVVAYPHIRAGIYTPPASTAQNRVGDEAIKTRGIPCGGRIQLDPELDLDSLALSAGAKVIARALQEYGAFVGDYSGSLSLYADNAPEALERWRELPIDDVSSLDASRFRVLQLGELYDNGNGD